MSLATITTANLESLIALVKKREAIQVEIAKIESQIESLLGGKAAAPTRKASGKKGKTSGKAKAAKAPKAVVPKSSAPAPVAPAAKPVKPAKVAKKGKRGALKEALLAELKAAGSKGVSVKDLSSKLGVKNQNLHVWFATTGKTVKGLKKAGTGIWAYAG